jgi:hypothetical protein
MRPPLEYYIGYSEEARVPKTRTATAWLTQRHRDTEKEQREEFSLWLAVPSVFSV